MTDAEKQKLIDKLAGGSKNAFGTRYSRDNRKWFVGKIIGSLLSQGVSDSKIIEQKTNDIITASNAAVKARVKTGAGSLVDKWHRYDLLESRTQIIYGMIAMNPEFLNPANSDYFSFILERRYRAIQRMQFFVNRPVIHPDPKTERSVFAYPGSTEKMKVNKDCMLPVPVWKAFLDDSVPFILTSLGRSDPVNADEKLFNINNDTERNLFACDPVATVLHMDALRAAKNPDALLKALAGVGDHYLKIDNPGGHCANSLDGQRLAAVSSAPVSSGEHVDIEVGKVGPILQLIQDQLTVDMLRDDNYISLNRPKLKFMIVLEDVQDTFTIESVNPVTRMVRAGHLTNRYEAGAKIYMTRLTFPFYSSLPYHFITDNRPDHALFEQLTVKSVDLQVGDHIYVINHPLYKIYNPSGDWGGEHSFVSEIGARDTSGNAFRNTLKVEGHGAPNQTLLEMSEEMLRLVNKDLSMLQTLTRIHLDNLKTNGRKTVTADTFAGKFKVTFIPRKEPGPDTNPIDVNVFEYQGKYTFSYMFRGKKQSLDKPGFVIKELASKPDAAFQVFNSDSSDSKVDVTHAPPLPRKVEFIGSGPSEQFTVSKWAVTWFNPQTTRFEFLPLFENDDKTPVRLTFDELVIVKPFFVTDEKGDVFVTRPRVDFSSAYQMFLKNNGAI